MARKSVLVEDDDPVVRAGGVGMLARQAGMELSLFQLSSWRRPILCRFRWSRTTLKKKKRNISK